jgi:signal transduction histidine kinase
MPPPAPEDHLLSLLEAERDVTLRLVLRSVRHALGTPFQVIGGHAALLERGSESRRTGDPSVISRKTREMADLVQRAVDYTVPSRQISVDVDAAALVAQTSELLRPAAIREDVSLTCELIDAPIRGDLVVADFRHAVLSLLGTCVRLAGAGGRVHAQVTCGSPTPPPRESGTALTGGAMIVVLVSLAGFAPAAAEIHREPWFDGQRDRRPVELALALVAGIARDAGGWLDAPTEPSERALRLVWPLEDALKRPSR